MASGVYNNAKKKLVDGSIDLDTDTIKCALLLSTHTVDLDGDVFWSDVSADESSGTNYTAGGATLGSKAITVDTTNDRAAFDAADVSWASSTIADARYAVLYKSTGVAGTSPLIAIFDRGSTASSSAATFSIVWPSGGILYIN